MKLMSDYKRYPEASPLKILAAVLPHQHIEKLLPDKTGKKLRCDSTYIVNVVNTIEKKFVDRVMMDCIRKR